MKLMHRCPHVLATSAAVLLACSVPALAPARARASVLDSRPADTEQGDASSQAGTPQAGGSGRTGDSLEAAATKAGDTGRAVAMSLIGLAFAVAGTVLAFKRDFKEAAGVLAVGVVAVLLATPAGVALIKDTVASLFGSQ